MVGARNETFPADAGTFFWCLRQLKAFTSLAMFTKLRVLHGLLLPQEQDTTGIVGFACVQNDGGFAERRSARFHTSVLARGST